MSRNTYRFGILSVCLLMCFHGCSSSNEPSARNDSQLNEKPFSETEPSELADTADSPANPTGNQTTEAGVVAEQKDKLTENQNEQTNLTDEESRQEAEIGNSADPSDGSVPMSVQDYKRFFIASEFSKQLGFEQDLDVTFGGEVVTQTEQSPQEMIKACQTAFAASGWVERQHQSWPMPQGASREDFLFEKQGHFVSFSTAGPNSGVTDFNLKYLGNVDVQKLPVPAHYQPLENPSVAYVGYVTDESIEDATNSCLQSMQQQGWRTFRCTSVPSSLPNPIQPNQVVGLFQNGYTLYLSVGRTPGYLDGRTVVNYVSTGILPIDLMITKDAESIELEVIHGKVSYFSKQSVSELRNQVSEHFADLDFPLMKSTGETAFIATYDSGDGEQVLVDISAIEDAKSSVQMTRQFDSSSK